MESLTCRKDNFFGRIKNEASVFEIIFWWITRALVIFCFLKNDVTLKSAVFYLTALACTFAVDILHIIAPKIDIASRFQSFICCLVLLSTVTGIGFGVIENYPDYDLVLQLAGGLFGGAAGYYVALALRRPKNRKEYTFATFFTLCFAGSLTIYRKLTEFFCDYFLGTNLCHVESVEDSHWFYRVFGMAMSPDAQRPLLDTDEDFIFSILGGIISMGVTYFKFRLTDKEAFKGERAKLSDLFRHFFSRCKAKIALEIRKVSEQASIFDLLFWWCVRFCMLYAFIVWDNRPEAILLSANLIGTFAITLIHLVFPAESVLCKISYKAQTLITVIVFLGSYCGNYCFVYNIVPRFDLFLHFISGVLCVMGGYYISLTLIKMESKKDSLLTALFSFCFSSFVMPAWEISEFIGDFIWGTSNQGFYWGPRDDSFFFKVFGRGVGNTKLYYLFDTVYDVLLAIVTTVITFILLYFALEYARKKAVKSTVKAKSAVTC